jgi:tetratricopeptide (TPR) repeat protein
LGLGSLREARRSFSEAESCYKKALEIYETLGSFTGRFRSLINLCSLSSSAGDYDSASRYIDQALILARKNKRFSQEAEALAEQANLYGALGDEARSRDILEKALTLLDKIKNMQLEAKILLARAQTHVEMAEHAEAVELYDRVISMRSIDPQTLSQAFAGKGWALQYSGKTKVPEAKDAYEKAMEIYETLGSFTDRFQMLLNLSDLSSSTGDYDPASRYLERALDLARKNKRLSQEVKALAEQAKLHDALGDDARSRDTFQQALALLDQIKNLQIRIRLVDLLSEIGWEREVEEALRAILVLDSENPEGLEALAWHLYTICGDLAEAEQLARRAVASGAATGLRAYHTLAAILTHLGRLQEAESILTSKILSIKESDSWVSPEERRGIAELQEIIASRVSCSVQDGTSGFLSGNWKGFYLHEGTPYSMGMRLEFHDGEVHGEGTDSVGKFTIAGHYQDDSGCRWTKQYLGKHAVSYRGRREERSLWGRWKIRSESSGEFSLWFDISHT